MHIPEEVLKCTPEQKKEILLSYSRTPEEIEEDIEKIKEWLKKQPHLPQDEEENRLKNVLLRNKCSLEKTKKKLDMYYSVRNLVPEVYTDSEPLNPEVNALLHSMKATPLPVLNKDLCRVSIFLFDKCTPEQFNTTVFNKMFFSQYDFRLTYDLCLGDHIICDFKGAKFGHVVKMTPVYCKNAHTLLEKAYSDRIKGMHFVNVPSVAQTFVTILGSILSKKIANRIHVHDEISQLQEYISKEILPVEYEGTYDTLENIHDAWVAMLEDKNSWYLEQVKRRSDESKRIGEPIDTDLFGMYGSFRQINID